jgi:hypothetical protein
MLTKLVEKFLISAPHLLVNQNSLASHLWDVGLSATRGRPTVPQHVDSSTLSPPTETAVCKTLTKSVKLKTVLFTYTLQNEHLPFRPQEQTRCLEPQASSKAFS